MSLYTYRNIVSSTSLENSSNFHAFLDQTLHLHASWQEVKIFTQNKNSQYTNYSMTLIENYIQTTEQTRFQSSLHAFKTSQFRKYFEFFHIRARISRIFPLIFNFLQNYTFKESVFYIKCLFISSSRLFETAFAVINIHRLTPLCIQKRIKVKKKKLEEIFSLCMP